MHVSVHVDERTLALVVHASHKTARHLLRTHLEHVLLLHWREAANHLLVFANGHGALLYNSEQLQTNHDVMVYLER